MFDPFLKDRRSTFRPIFLLETASVPTALPVWPISDRAALWLAACDVWRASQSYDNRVRGRGDNLGISRAKCQAQPLDGVRRLAVPVFEPGGGLAHVRIQAKLSKVSPVPEGAKCRNAISASSAGPLYLRQGTEGGGLAGL